MSARDLAATVRTDIMRLADGETTEEMLTVEARALAALAALEKQAADAQALLRERNDSLIAHSFALERAEEALRQRRPVTDEEWAAMMAEHDVVDEARRISRSAGEVNSFIRLDAALKKYDAAVNAAHASREALAAAGADTP